MGPGPLPQPEQPVRLSRVGVIAALPAEAACLTGCNIPPEQPYFISDNLLVLVTGTGADRARNGAIKLLEYKVRSLVSCGVAGALDISLQPGDLIVPEMVIHSTQTFLTNPEWRQRLHDYMQKSNFRVSAGTLAEADEIPDSATAKAHLRSMTGAVAVDMESAAIAAVAGYSHIDYMAIRAISDDAITSVPEVVLKHTDCYGQPVLPDFIFGLLRQPGQIKLLIRLAQGFRAARQALLHLGQTSRELLLYR